MNRREWLIAVPLLVGLAVCAAGFVNALRIENAVDGIVGLRTLQTPAGPRVAAVTTRAVHVFDGGGSRLARQPLQTLGLQDWPNDMDWTVDGQGRVEAWFFDDSVPRVRRCQWDEARRVLDTCTDAARGAQLKGNPRSRAVHLAVDRPQERLFIADAKSGRVQAFSLDGQRLAGTGPDQVPLHFPNRLRYHGQDALLVADNDHRRLAWVHVPVDRPWRLRSTLYASDHPQARMGRTKVTDVAVADDGTLWMLAVGQGQKDGDVLVFDARRQPVARADLPPGADPLVMDVLGSTALVADYSLVRLYQIDGQGKLLGDFGDAAFRAELQPMAQRSGEARWWRRGSLAAGGLLLVLGLLLGWKFGSRPQAVAVGRSAPSTEAPQLTYPVLIEPGAGYQAGVRRQLLWQVAVGVSCLVAVAAAAAVLDGVNNWRFAVGLIVPLAMVPVVVWLTRRAQAPALHVFADHLEVIRAGRPTERIALDAIAASEHSLLLGRSVLHHKPLPHGFPKLVPPYDPVLLQAALLGRLAPEQWVTAGELQRRQLAAQPLWQRVLLVVVTLGLITWLLRDMLPL